MDIDIFKPDNWESWSDCDYPEKKREVLGRIREENSHKTWVL